jgi:hypothetical protein
MAPGRDQDKGRPSQGWYHSNDFIFFLSILLSPKHPWMEVKPSEETSNPNQRRVVKYNVHSGGREYRKEKCVPTTN